MPVMNLKLLCAAAHCAARILFDEVLANGGPVARPGVTKRMLALGSIDEMANDGHKKARIARASVRNNP